jgi:CMP/dCMP kinase
LRPAAERLVTVDGPAGSGKSTLGTRLALALGLPMLDTGLFYRGLCVAALRDGLEVHDARGLAELARRTRIEPLTDPARPEGSPDVLVDGQDPGEALRDPGNAAMLAAVSSNPEVRTVLLEPQRALGRGGAVAVGRDCGTVVFPEATVKFFLEAPEAVRLQRRTRQLGRDTAEATGPAMTAEVRERDRADSTRAAAPLSRPGGAHVIDTGRLGIDAMVQRALALCVEAGL